MNIDHLKYFFDFEKCWTEIMADYKFDDDGLFDIELMDDIEDKKIVNFIMDQIPMHNEECDINNGVLMFCFSEEYQTANESNNQNDSLSILIEYDLKKECFINFTQEQG